MFHRGLFVARVSAANRDQSALYGLYAFTAIGIERRRSLRENDPVDTLENLLELLNRAQRALNQDDRP